MSHRQATVQTLPWGAQRTSSDADENITLSGFGHSDLHTAAWTAAFGDTQQQSSSDIIFLVK